MKINKIFLDTFIILIIFLMDRISKIYILEIAKLETKVDIYVNSYLNFYLIWNKGTAFGLFSFDESFIYQSISLIVFIICIGVIIMIIKSKGLKKYALILVLGGALGNFFDRMYYSAVPDFIDFHIGNFHWFIFNVADIFITIGVICLILDELFNYKIRNEND
jgi:signal peptidase II